MPANLQRVVLGLRLIGGTLACLWLAGCAGYKLGPTGGQADFVVARGEDVAGLELSLIHI